MGVMHVDGGTLVFRFDQAPEGTSYRHGWRIERCPRCGEMGEKRRATAKRLRHGFDYVHKAVALQQGNRLKTVRRCFVPEGGTDIKVGHYIEEMDTDGYTVRVLVIESIEEQEEQVVVRNVETNRPSKINVWRLLEDGLYQFSEEKPDVSERESPPDPEPEAQQEAPEPEANPADFQDEDLL